MSTENPADSRRPLSESEAEAEARRIIEGLWTSEPAATSPTSYVDRTPVPAYGTTPPVVQPDNRVVPPWAAGVAVASIGAGAGITGVGCGVWLVLQGLASVTLTSVLFVTLPIAAVAAMVVAVGSVVRSVKAANVTTHHHYSGPVHQENNTQVENHGKWFGGRSTTNVSN
ncbi:hypothetical protein [Streptomyces sp. NBC_01506]|uniref:hypothetical protein n=1 Tax=Streptomyces sp. NBC_01506 TaxID=2903887 RepID=UPI002F912A02